MTAPGVGKIVACQRNLEMSSLCNLEMSGLTQALSTSPQPSQQPQ